MVTIVFSMIKITRGLKNCFENMAGGSTISRGKLSKSRHYESIEMLRLSLYD